MTDNILNLINSSNDEDMILGLRMFVETHSSEEVIKTFPIYEKYGHINSSKIPSFCFKRKEKSLDLQRLYELRFKDIVIRIGGLTIVAVYKYQENLLTKVPSLKILNYE